MEREKELIRRSLAGDQEACRRIVEMHHRVARAAVQAVLGRSEDVEDVLQDVFVKVFVNLPGFRGESALGTWIHSIARNEALGHLRRRRIDSQLSMREAGESPSASGHAENVDLRDLLERALAKIGERERTAIELRYTGGCSYREIAAMMELPEGTVKTLIHRGKLQLRKLLSSRLGSDRRRRKK